MVAPFPFLRILMLALITIMARTHIVDFTAITGLDHVSMAEDGEDTTGEHAAGMGMAGEDMVGVEAEVMSQIICLGGSHVKALFDRFR